MFGWQISDLTILTKFELIARLETGKLFYLPVRHYLRKLLKIQQNDCGKVEKTRFTYDMKRNRFRV